MSHTDRLLEHLISHPAVPVPRGDVTDAAIRVALDRLRPAPKVFALFEALVQKDTSFALFDFETYPSVLVRKPWKEGVMGDHEVCVGKNGAGDLYLFDVQSGHVRFLVHDEDWQMGSKSASFDAFLEDTFWSCLESLEADDLDDASEEQMARIRCALAIGSVEALNDDVKEKLVELGVIAE